MAELGLSGEDLGMAIKDALGLPEHTVEFTLYCGVNYPIEVSCSYLVAADEEDKAEIKEVLKHYKLVEQDDN